MALSTIPFSALSSDASKQGVNFRNLIINGDMSIAQRGTSTTGVTSAGYYSLDRYVLNMNSAGTFTVSQSTDVPSGQGFGYSYKLDCTTADASLSAGDYVAFTQRFEGQMLQSLKKGTSNAESVTLSFWVKTNKTGTYQTNINDNDNSRIIAKTFTVDSANTWEKKTLTFVGDTVSGFDNDNARSCTLEMWLASGTTFNSGSVPTTWQTRSNADLAAGTTVNIADSTANEWYITGVQLEVGASASDFEFLPYDVNLQRCQRYYQFVNLSWGGNGVSGEVYRTGNSLTTMMRASPSVTLTRIDDANFDASSGVTQRVTNQTVIMRATCNGTGNARYYIWGGYCDSEL